MPRTRLQFFRRFTTRVVNPVTRRFVGWVPGFAIVHQVGRISGRQHRTPMSVFRDGDAYVFALTYSADVQWVKNVVAAGACELEQRGHRVRLVDPQVITDPTRRLMPQPVRFFLGLMGVSEFLRMRPGSDDTGRTG